MSHTITKIVIKDPEPTSWGRVPSTVWWATIYYDDKTKIERPLTDKQFDELLENLKDEDVPECTMSPDCPCDDCRAETEFYNFGGADRF